MEILGLLDTLESLVLDSFKIPLTRRTIVDETKVLDLIDKIRLVVESGEDFAKKAIDSERRAKQEFKEAKKTVTQITEGLEGAAPEDAQGKAMEIIQQAYQIAKEIRLGADKYADEVLANLEVTSSRILRSLRSGRERLSKVMGQGQEQKVPLKEEKRKEAGPPEG